MSKAQLAPEFTVALKNQVGELAKVFSVLARGQVNLCAYTAYVEGEGGWVKIIPSDAQAAAQALDSAGYSSSKKDVLVIEAPERLGAGAELMSKLAEAGLNVTHSHATVAGPGTVLVVIHTDDNNKALGVIG